MLHATFWGLRPRACRDGHRLAPRKGVADGRDDGTDHARGSGPGHRRLGGNVRDKVGLVHLLSPVNGGRFATMARTAISAPSGRKREAARSRERTGGMFETIRSVIFGFADAGWRSTGTVAKRTTLAECSLTNPLTGREAPLPGALADSVHGAVARAAERAVPHLRTAQSARIAFKCLWHALASRRYGRVGGERRPRRGRSGHDRRNQAAREWTAAWMRSAGPEGGGSMIAMRRRSPRSVRQRARRCLRPASPAIASLPPGSASGRPRAHAAPAWILSAVALFFVPDGGNGFGPAQVGARVRGGRQGHERAGRTGETLARSRRAASGPAATGSGRWRPGRSAEGGKRATSPGTPPRHGTGRSAEPRPRGACAAANGPARGGLRGERRIAVGNASRNK